MNEQPHRALTLITTVWLTGMLLVRMQVMVAQGEYSFTFATRYFLPEIAVAAIFAMFLPAVWMRRRWISPVLVALAALLLVLLVATGFTDLWFVSFLLLLFLAYVVRPVAPRSAGRAAHPTMRGLLVLSRVLMYLGTPGAYVQLSAGATGAVEGFRQGHWSLAPALLICSLLGLYGLWTMWSISTRTWTNRKYVVHSESGRAKDACGLLAAWIAVIGFAALSTPIFRVVDVIIFSVLLVPSLLVTTVIAALTVPVVVEQSARVPLSGLVRRTQVRHYAGIVAGLAVGLLGITFLMPPTYGGWGPCDWTIMFPIESDLWPTERGIVFDACDTGLAYQTMLLAIASFAFWISGLLAVVIGRSRDPWQGAIVAAVTALIVLSWTIKLKVIAVLALPLIPLPPISRYIDWGSTIGIGVAVVLWAARLGYLGGQRAARSVEPQIASDGAAGTDAV